jgi:hypothetical protein
VVVVLVGANVLALWCEMNMDSNQSLLRGLGTLMSTRDDPDGAARGKPSVDDQDEGGEDAGGELWPANKLSRRRTTRIVHFRW